MSRAAHDLFGLIAAPHTPFDRDGQLDVDAVEAQAAHLDKTGVVGAFIAGSTGEGMSLTVEERMNLTAAWVAAAEDRDLCVIVHVGGNCILECMHLAQHAQETGADAHAVFAPSYFHPSGVDGLVEWCAMVAEYAPELPFFYYDVPALTGMKVMTSEFLVQSRQQIPTLMGVKYTNPDMADFLRCARFAGGEMSLYYGNDEALLAGLAMGAIGAVGSSYNFAAPLYHRIAEAFLVGDLAAARREQAKSAALIDLLVHYDYMTAAKSTMGFLDVPVGHPRPPLDSLDAAAQKRLRSDLEELGFFEWIEDGPENPRKIWDTIGRRAREGLGRSDDE